MEPSVHHIRQLSRRAVAVLPTMGDCIRSPASRCQRKSVQHYDLAEPHWNAYDRRYLFLHGEGHRCHGGTSQMAYKLVIQASANHVVDLRWNASTSSNVTGYNLYRSPDGTTWNKINASLIASTLYADSTAANGSTYYYPATAVDIYGQESSKTAPIRVAVP